jgi:hypothetical protein
VTNDCIEKYIDCLNRNEFGGSIFRTSLSSRVDFAKVWPVEPRGDVANEGSDKFYFIKNEDGVYIAAVLDMHSDLHVYVKNEYRKKGYLSSAVNEVILPHIGRTGRKKQVVTFENPEIGEYCVRNWGFSLVSESSAEKSLSSYHGLAPLPCKGYKISRKDYVGINEKIHKARLYIVMVKEQLEASLGEIEDSDIVYMEYELFNLDDQVLTLIENIQGDLD